MQVIQFTSSIYRQCYKPVIILTLTPRFKALLMVSALSCLGGSNRGRRPTNSHGPPVLSFDPSGTCWNSNSSNTLYECMLLRVCIGTDIVSHIQYSGMELKSICTWWATARDRSPRSANLSMIECTLFAISDLLWARLRICNAVRFKVLVNKCKT